MVTLITTEPGVKYNNLNNTINGRFSKQNSKFFGGSGKGFFYSSEVIIIVAFL
jgi:hypothetical protein